MQISVDLKEPFRIKCYAMCYVRWYSRYNGHENGKKCGKELKNVWMNFSPTVLAAKKLNMNAPQQSIASIIRCSIRQKKIYYSILTGQNWGLSGLKNIWPVIRTGDLLSVILSRIFEGENAWPALTVTLVLGDVTLGKRVILTKVRECRWDQSRVIKTLSLA